MEGRGDQHVEDLDRGESIRAPTQRYKLIYATMLSGPIRPHHVARRRLRSIDDDDGGISLAPTTEEWIFRDRTKK